ncbi:SUKH-4 family immunity protein [Kitasatospora sp. NPDC057542]|uniref:SUKH-4 family immunity protein n=1 Tax=Streptomycetaceae TaxID=2062 RepID=UPI001CCBD99A|nr:SUKH-4 family immunity protein [Streptomyces sp. LS1784]
MSRIDRSMMESVFEAEELITLDEDALMAIPHEPTRAFLRDIGLPGQFDTWLQLDGPLADEGVVTIVDAAGAAELAAKYPGFGVDTSRWMSIGAIGLDSFALDVENGTMYCVPESGAQPCVLNSGIEAFAYFLYALEVERPNYDLEVAEGPIVGNAEDRLQALMEEVDPVALASPDSTWYLVLENVKHLLDYR